MNPLHYPSLELCKKLTKIGFNKTDMLFAYCRYEEDVSLTSYKEVESWKMYNLVANCPSVMEMLDAMPRMIYDYDSDGDQHRHIFGMSPTKSGKYSVYYSVNYILEEKVGTLPNALAEMILWLAENKHLSFIK